MTREQEIADYMQRYYSDGQLVAALDHAESGRLAFHSCCCFAGIPSAVHALQGAHPGSVDRNFSAGHDGTVDVPWQAMSSAFCALGSDDQERRAKLIPLIKAEISRRESLRSQVNEEVCVAV